MKYFQLLISATEISIYLIIFMLNRFAGMKGFGYTSQHPGLRQVFHYLPNQFNLELIIILWLQAFSIEHKWDGKVESVLYLLKKNFIMWITLCWHSTCSMVLIFDRWISIDINHLLFWQNMRCKYFDIQKILFYRGILVFL